MYFKIVTECLRNYWKLQEIALNGCNCLEMARKIAAKCFICLELAGKGLKGLGKGWKSREMVGHQWKWLYHSGNSRTCVNL